MTTLRRFLVVAALLFWQGGFTFYTAVVVPIGTDVLQSALEQGRITRRVTVYLNLSGAVALAVLGWDVAQGDPVRLRSRLRWLFWGLLVVTLLLLFWLHPRLEEYFDVEKLEILNRREFRRLHRWYLWVSTVQWACGVASIWLMLRAWQEQSSHHAPRDAGSSRGA